MKLQAIFLAVMAGTALGSSHHHKHRHLHDQKRDNAEVIDGTKVVTGTAVVIMYEYNGNVLTEDEVCKGMADGSINWEGSVPAPPECKTSPAASAASPETTASASSLSGAGFLGQESSNSVASSAVAGSSASASVSSGSSSGYELTNSNVDKDFPDGQIDCSTFPSDYGAISVPWAGFEGWSGVQAAQTSGGAVSHLATAPSGQGCQPGSDGADTYCSYACPAGYQKSQWPTSQGSAAYAVSVGGLRCGSDNKLHLTNTALSSKLCVPGTGTVNVANHLGKNAAVCRTDYPGTEAETVPLNTTPGETSPLTCPDSATYYQHVGSQTTAQYYVNDAGIAVNDACQWGKDTTGEGLSAGNWAPIVIGAGQDENGATWLSIMSSCQNDPAKCNDLSYSIELTGDFGGNNGCYYTQSGGVGYWCTQGGLSDFQAGSSSCNTHSSQSVPGCTVQLMSGDATYNFRPTN